MSRSQMRDSAGSLLLVTVILNGVILQWAFILNNNNLYGALLVTLPLLLYAIYFKKRQRRARYQKPIVSSRGLSWYKMLRTRPRHYFMGTPPAEPAQKPAPKTTAYRTVKRRYSKIAIRKPS